MAKYSTIRNDVGIALRDELRTNSSFLNKLGLTTSNAKNHIFYKRPINELKEFSNPRVVIEPSTSPGLKFVGNNPDGQKNGNIQYDLFVWLDEKPIALASETEDILLNLFNSYQVSMEKGFCFVDLESSNQLPDPEKAGTIQMNGNLIAEINGGL